MKSFVVQVIIYEVVLMVIYGVYVQVKPNVAPLHN